MRPSPAVLVSFGASADAGPVPLPGGQGSTWRAGELVLKPAGDPRGTERQGYDPADFGQLLARALVDRLVTEVISGAETRPGSPRPPTPASR